MLEATWHQFVPSGSGVHWECQMMSFYEFGILVTRHHTTYYVWSLYVIFLHVETFEDRNPKIVA